MRSAKISDVRARFADFLRLVRRGGEVAIMNRTVPVARLVPFDEPAASPLQIEEPPLNPQEAFRKRYPPVQGPATDSLRFLMEERGFR